jgi:hypothetical protein
MKTHLPNATMRLFSHFFSIAGVSFRSDNSGSGVTYFDPITTFEIAHGPIMAATMVILFLAYGCDHNAGFRRSLATRRDPAVQSSCHSRRFWSWNSLGTNIGPCKLRLEPEVSLYSLSRLCGRDESSRRSM